MRVEKIQNMNKKCDQAQTQPSQGIKTILNISYSLQTSDEPIHWWFSQTVAQSEVQCYLSSVGTRLHYQEHHFVHPIAVVPHLRREGCRALSDINSPSVSTGSFENTIFCNRLNVETTELTC